jgi:hypothetical protein
MTISQFKSQTLNPVYEGVHTSTRESRFSPYLSQYSPPNPILLEYIV